MRIAIQANLSMGFSRQILRGFLAYRQMRRDWYLLINPFWEGMPPSAIPQVDAVCILGGENFARGIPPGFNRRVYVGGSIERRGAGFVDADNEAVGRMASEHFQRLGFRNVAAFNSSPNRFGGARCRGFADHARAHGLWVSLLDVTDSAGLFHLPSPATGRDRHRVMGEWIQSLPKPVGVLAANDLQAIELAMACGTVGLDIPHDVALLGVDNDALVCEIANVPISSIDHGNYRMGWEAGEMIDGWMTTGLPPDPARRRVLPVGVVDRASTDILAVRDSAVAKALTYIRRDACRGISVDEVARHTGTNRRTLERRFQQVLGRGIKREIQMCRFDTARRMLATSDVSVAEVAERCGFSSDSEFSHAFKRQTAVSPSTYRRMHGGPSLPA